MLLLVASETGHVYTFATPKLQPLITKPEGKNLIQQCLNSTEIPSQPVQQPQANARMNYGGGDASNGSGAFPEGEYPSEVEEKKPRTKVLFSLASHAVSFLMTVSSFAGFCPS